MNNAQSNFYVTGGTLRSDAPCYVEREADRALLEGLQQGEFCYVLTSRQMGKSSLMVRTADNLRREGTSVAVLDLTSVGQNLTAEQWYDGLLGHVGRQLHLEDELEKYWLANSRLGPLARWMQALREVVLPRCPGRVVIFIDEIDAVRSLPFSTDEFFAAIRECYNRRSEDPEYARLTFCLLGVATPSDLIRDTRTTPFNVGRRIELRDFTAAEAGPLARGLGREEKLADRLLERILYWTGGHPYLTQRLCDTVAHDAKVTSPVGVDRVCEDLFLSHRARERDDNLLFVRERLLRQEEDRAGILDMYDQMRRGRRVRDEETNNPASIVRLSGIARVTNGCMDVRNRIYQKVFDRDWVQANMPDAEKRRQRRAYRRGLVRASAVAAMLFALVGGAFYWFLDAYVWEHVAYFNTFAKRWGVFEGVGPLSANDVAHRAVSLKFYRQGRFGPVVRMEAVNSRGELNPDHDLGTYLRQQEENTIPVPLRACRWEFVRDNQRKVIYEKALNKLGNPVWAFVYAPTRAGEPVRGFFVGPTGYPQPQRHSTAEYVEIEYTQEGFEGIKRYYDLHGKRALGPDRAYAVASEYDRRGLYVKRMSLNADDKPMVDLAGNSGVVVEYDVQGNQVRVEHVDADGQRTLTKQNVAIFEAKYDQYGNVLEIACFDKSNQPTQHKDGYAKVTGRYDERGNRIEWAYFDEQGKPTRHKDGSAKATARYDERGNRVEGAYLDEQENPTQHKDGYAKVTARYDQRGNRIEWAFFGEQGKPARHKDGFAKATARYDERGNRVETAYFDEQGKPTRIRDGCAKETARHDERGNCIEWAYFDEQGKPTRIRDGYAKATARHDERGNCIEWAYFDEQGKPNRRKDGYAKCTARFDERGDCVEQCYLDEQDKPVRGKAGYAKITFKCDEHGNRIEEAYFDEKGKPCQHSDGYSKFSARYDDHGNCVEISYFDEQGKPTRHQDGNAKATGKYDGRGNRVETAYFDEQGKPTRHNDGNAKLTARYDVRGICIETCYFDEQGKPVLIKDRYAKFTSRHDERGNLLEKRFFNEQEKPTRHKDGFATTKARYDDHGNCIEVSYFDEKGKPTRHHDGYARGTCKYDGRGNRVETAYFDEQGKPTRYKDGYALFTARFDERGNCIEQNYFDEKRQSTPNWEGYNKITIRYDQRDNCLEMAYFDNAGRPTKSTAGYAKYTAKFDERDNEIERLFFDAENMAARHSDGYSKSTTKYDDSNKQVEETFFGYDGKNGYVKMVVKLNKKGERIEWTYFDANDKPARHIDGHSRYTKKYDESGKQVEEAFIGNDGKDGYVKMVIKLDDKERRVENTYFDVANEPARHKNGYQKWTRNREPISGKVIEDVYSGYDGKNGYAKMVVKLNDQGKGVENTYFDAADMPTRHKNGYSKWTRVYHDSGKLAEESFWGYDGEQFGYVKEVVKVNETGKGIEWSFFDAKDQPARHNGGYSKWTRKFHESGKRIEETFFGYDGEKKGYVKMVVKLNDQGKGVENTYFDAADMPARHKNGNNKWTRVYDDSGKVAEESFWGYDGKNGYYKMVTKFNKKGQAVEWQYFDSADKPTLHRDGNAGYTVKYDERGNEIERAFFGLDRRPKTITAGYATISTKYDERGNMIERAYFDETNKAALHSDGYARKTAIFKGLVQVEQHYYDVAGKELRTKIFVEKMTPNGQGDKLGLKPGDIFLSYDGKELTYYFSFIAARKSEKVGDMPRELIVLRDGQRLSFQVSAGLLGTTLADRVVPAKAAEE